MKQFFLSLFLSFKKRKEIEADNEYVLPMSKLPKRWCLVPRKYDLLSKTTRDNPDSREFLESRGFKILGLRQCRNFYIAVPPAGVKRMYKRCSWYYITDQDGTLIFKFVANAKLTSTCYIAGVSS